MSRTLALRANGIANHMVEPVDPKVHRIAVAVVRQVAEKWRQWGAKAGEIRKSDREYSEKGSRDRPTVRSRQRSHRAASGGRTGAGAGNRPVPARKLRPGPCGNPTGGSQTVAEGQKALQPHGTARRGRTQRFLRSYVVRTCGTPLGNPHRSTRYDRAEVRRRVHCKASWLQVALVGEDGETAAILEAEGYGMSGLTSRFVGFVPTLDDGPTGFFTKQPIAVFEHDRYELIEKTREMLDQQREKGPDLQRIGLNQT